MFRRLVLGALAAPVLLRPALAQDRRPSMIQNDPVGADNRSASGPTTDNPGSAGTPDPAPEQARRAMLGAMAFALESSRLAAMHGELPAVRAFGQLEMEEQAAFASARRMAGLQPPAPTDMEQRQRDAMQRLASLRGGDFDRLYVEGQVAGHEELFRLHEAVAGQAAAPREERMLATVAVPAIRTHLVMLGGVRQALRG